MRTQEKKYPKNIEFILGDAENTHLKSNSFDVVICHSILHHLDIKAAISEIKRLLKKGGVLFIADEPGLLNPAAFIGRKFFPTNIHTPGEKPFIIRNFRKLIIKNGFKEEIAIYDCIFSNILPYNCSSN